MAPPGDVGDYLRGIAPLDQVMEEIRRRHYIDGKLPTSIPIGPEQATALGRLGCTRLRGGRLYLADLDAALRDSRFMCGVSDALEAWAAQSLTTRAGEREAEEAEWSRFAAELTAGRTVEDGDPAALWLAQDGRYVRQEWAATRGSMHDAILLAVRASRAIRPDGEFLPLPAFANAVAGGPHNLDLDRPARRYFDRILCSMFPEVEVAAPLTAECREKLLAAAGLIVDDISSDVIAANLEGNGRLPEIMGITGLPLTLPLFTIARLGDVSARGGIAYVVENPPVFRLILSRLDALPPAERPTLLCTAGQLSIAARKLLDLLVVRGAIIRYSGDFDPGGLAIARGLIRRYGEAVCLWRMDTDAYARAVSPSTPPADPKRLRALADDFPDLCAAIRDGGVAFQESLADILADEVISN